MQIGIQKEECNHAIDKICFPERDVDVSYPPGEEFSAGRGTQCSKPPGESRHTGLITT